MEHEHHNHIHNSAKENIRVAFVLNLGFSILEAIGGFLTNSISIFTDAVHDFGDSISIGVSYLLEKKSQKNPDLKYTYGYLRYSLLGALITSIILLTGSLFVLFEAIPRIINPVEVNHDAMIIFAIFGVIINGYAAYRTSSADKHNEKAINLHMLEDVFGWIAVLVGSICIKLFGLYIIDPILSVLIALYILFHVYRYIKEVFDILMEKVPDNIEVDKIKESLESDYDEIKDIHHIHIWSMDGVNNYMTCHIALKKDISKDKIIELKKSIRESLDTFNIKHVTLEIEFTNEECNNHEC